MLLLNLTLFLLNVFLLSCCNVYNDFCDTMETSSTPLPLKPRVTRDLDTTLSANMTKLEMASWVTGVLDNLFGAGYNKQFRPGTGLKPTQVEVNIAIRSMGPIDETQERYTLDCYFRSVLSGSSEYFTDYCRQYWYDERLKFNQSDVIDELAMNWQFLEKIWRPDTFFLNGKDSYLHKIAVPNRFIASL